MLFTMLEEVGLIIAEPGVWVLVFVWHFASLFVQLGSLSATIENLATCIISALIYTFLKVIK